MCGLAGFLNVSTSQTSDELRSMVGAMVETLHHRGPNDTGLWCEPAAGIALGFKRLSIVDLSQAGHQPMASSCGKYVIVFNGEIYNHNDLRTELVALGRSFRGHSDTEVLAEGFAVWGVEATIKRCVGMFAIAAWNTDRRELTLVRDRLGKKPLYYARSGLTLVFGSETKALKAHPKFKPVIDREAISQFLAFSYLQNRSIYRDVQVTPPGTMITFAVADEAFWAGQRQPEIKPYWTLDETISAGLNSPFAGSYESALAELEKLLTDAVGRRMLADVPLGALLSGGIDSSLVVALMQKQSDRPVRTFTIGFEEDGYNEAPYAKRVAEHLKTEHTQLYVTGKDARDVIPRLPKLFDEPFADSSQIPTFLVCELARRHVTVALSGDGGDELFCGYRRYFEALHGFFPSGGPKRRTGGMLTRLARRSRSLPPVVRHAIAQAGYAAARLPGLGRYSAMLAAAAAIFSDAGPHYRYLRNLTHWHREDVTDLGVNLPDLCSLAPHLSQCFAKPLRQPDDFQQAWQAYDTRTYLPGDILTKVDRTSMGVSLEARTPLLDHRVVEFSWRLPHEYQAQAGTGKRLLRDILARHVPRKLFERPKVGFGAPIDSWLRGPLKEWAEELLDERRLKREGFLNPKPIRQKWSEHLSGKANWHYLLWDVLMFQAWLAEYPTT